MNNVTGQCPDSSVPMKSNHLGCGLAHFTVSTIALGSILDLSVYAFLRSGLQKLFQTDQELGIGIAAGAKSALLNSCCSGTHDKCFCIMYLIWASLLHWYSNGCLGVSIAAEVKGKWMGLDCKWSQWGSADLQLCSHRHGAGFCWLLGHWAAVSTIMRSICLCFLPVVTLTASVDCCCTPTPNQKSQIHNS